MQQKLQTRAFERVAPTLQPGEQPVMAARAMVGKFSSGRFGAIASQAVMQGGGGALGAALGGALASTKRQYVVLTDRRLIFLPQTAFLGRPGKKILGEVPREQVSLAETKMGFVSLLRVAFGTAGDGVALTFPRAARKDAESLAAALQPAQVA